MPKTQSSRFVVRKFDGDDCYSYAVFRREDVRGRRGVVFSGDAQPIVAGCGRDEARSHARDLERGGRA